MKTMGFGLGLFVGSIDERAALEYGSGADEPRQGGLEGDRPAWRSANWFASRESFHDPCREPVVAFNPEPRGADVLDGAAQEVLAAQRDRHQLEDALAGAQHRARTGYVVGK